MLYVDEYKSVGVYHCAFVIGPVFHNAPAERPLDKHDSGRRPSSVTKAEPDITEKHSN